MKIAITVSKDDKNAYVDQRFGRAGGFLIYDDSTNVFTFKSNSQNLQAQQGAGVQASQSIIDEGVNVIITGNVGPKAFAALNAAGIEIFTGAALETAKSAVEAFGRKELRKVTSATKDGHW